MHYASLQGITVIDPFDVLLLNTAIYQQQASILHDFIIVLLDI